MPRLYLLRHGALPEKASDVFDQDHLRADSALLLAGYRVQLYFVWDLPLSLLNPAHSRPGDIGMYRKGGPVSDRCMLKRLGVRGPSTKPSTEMIARNSGKIANRV